jgi:hypothetical protein
LGGAGAGTFAWIDATARSEVKTAMTYREHDHVHETAPAPAVEEGNGIVGYAAIKYTAIVVIVLAILAFVALYLIPALTD